MKLIQNTFFYPLLLLVFMAQSVHGQVVINEVQYQGTDQVELKNIGTTTINVTNWWFCNLFAYNQLSSLTASGSLNMAPGDIVTLSGFALNNTASDLGLYNSGSFASPTAMQDFVQWGAGGLGREPVAVAKGIWTAFDFVPTVSASGNSIEYIGVGDTSASWYEQMSPTFDAENGIITCDAGSIFFTGIVGGDTMYYCQSANGSNNTGMFLLDSAGTSSVATDTFVYVITTNTGSILGVLPGDVADVSGAPFGECWVFGLSYNGTLQAMAGQDINTAALSSACYDLSDNFLVIFRDSTDGGTVQAFGSTDTVGACVGNVVIPVSHVTTANLLNYAYIITDDNDNILAWSTEDTLDLSGAPAGICHIWGWSYHGQPAPVMGANISTLDDDPCEDISSNWISVVRQVPDGGTVTSNGLDTVVACAGNVIVPVSHTTTADFLDYYYVITSDEDTILAFSDLNTLDLSGAPAGECHIYGWSKEGVPDPVLGAHVSTLDDDACEDLSADFITVIREAGAGDAGSITTMAGDTVYYCKSANGSNNDGMFAVDSVGANVTSSFTYIITSNSGSILGILPGDVADVSGAPEGECWVFGVAYNGNLTAMAGDDIMTAALSDACFNLSSNFVVIFRDSTDGGTVQAFGSMDTVNACAGDVIVPVSHTTSADLLNYAYVITDDNDDILAWSNSNTLDLSGAPAGICHIWGWSYQGQDDPVVGMNISTLDDDACEDISSNWISVVREGVDGGMVQAESGADTLLVCFAGGTPLVHKFDSTATVGEKFSYVVTDVNGVILGIPPADMVDFAPAGPGECWVWGLSYTGDITAMLGDTATSVDLTDGCFSLSANFIVVLRDDGGIACATGIGDLIDLEGVSIYPNPVQHTLQLEIAASSLEESQIQIEVYSMAGQRVQTRQETLSVSTAHRLEIPVSELPNGIYLIRVLNGEKVFRSKFVKQ